MLTGGDATITAASNAASTVKAEPTAGRRDLDELGVGASVALNLITDTTAATSTTASALTGAANVTLSATAADAAITEAKMGAAGGKVDIAPAVAVTLSNVTTTTRVGTDGAAVADRSVHGTATQNATRVLGSRCGRRRRVDSGGRRRAGADDREPHGQCDDGAQHHGGRRDHPEASGISASAREASASASGAPENSATGPARGGGGGAGGGVDQQVQTQRDQRRQPRGERRQDLRVDDGAERLDLGRQGQCGGGGRARPGDDGLEGDHRGNRRHADLRRPGHAGLEREHGCRDDRRRLGLAGRDGDDRRGGRDHPRERDEPGARCRPATPCTRRP